MRSMVEGLFAAEGPSTAFGGPTPEGELREDWGAGNLR